MSRRDARSSRSGHASASAPATATTAAASFPASTRLGTVAGAARSILGRGSRVVLGRMGYGFVRLPGVPHEFPVDLDPAVRATVRAVAPYTLTSVERVAALVHAVRHLARHDIPGAFVECGVWRGGSMLAVARTLVEEGITDRELYLYDTFTRMPPPGERDWDAWGVHASEYFAGPVDPHDTDGYRYLPLAEVKRVLATSGYPAARMHFVPGLVEETIPAAAPPHIALLRLDTDWYESTKHEMDHLFPRIVDGGFLLVDDYGQFAGARAAVDDHLATTSPPVFLHRIDFTGRLAQVRRS